MRAAVSSTAGLAGDGGADQPTARHGLGGARPRQEETGSGQRLRRSATSVGASGGEVDADTERRIQRGSGGASMPAPMMRSMEQAFGTDFSHGPRTHRCRVATAQRPSAGLGIHDRQRHLVPRRHARRRQRPGSAPRRARIDPRGAAAWWPARRRATARAAGHRDPQSRCRRPPSVRRAAQGRQGSHRHRDPPRPQRLEGQEGGPRKGEDGARAADPDPDRQGRTVELPRQDRGQQHVENAAEAVSEGASRSRRGGHPDHPAPATGKTSAFASRRRRNRRPRQRPRRNSRPTPKRNRRPTPKPSRRPRPRRNRPRSTRTPTTTPRSPASGCRSWWSTRRPGRTGTSTAR